MNNRIVLIGAGSAMFGLGALGDMFKSKSLEGSTVVLCDIDAQALSRVEHEANLYIAEHHIAITVEATTERTKALIDADFCIISIEIGDRYKLWEQDWQIPLQFGIKQVYGENGGPGGLFHALRIIPPILDICQDVQNICPECYVINLSNPMTSISMAIHRKFPELRILGLCHEISSLVIHLPKILGIPFEDLSIKAGGLNHFSVLLYARYRDSGRDAYPEIMEKAVPYFQKTLERGLFMYIIKHFGKIPITTDSHFSEYIHWSQEVADHYGVLDFYDNYKKECFSYQVDPQNRLSRGTEPEEYWRVVPIIEGILADSRHEELAVNLPNHGLIPNLPEDMIVEVPAIVDKHGVHGVGLHDLMPSGFSGLLCNRVGNLNVTVDAALQGSKELAMQALLVDPTMNSLLAAEKMFDVMLHMQKEYLGYLK